MLVLGVQHNDLVFIIHCKVITISLVTTHHHSDKNFLPCHENLKKKKIFMYLAMLGLCCITWDLVSDQGSNLGPCIGSVES